MSNRKYNNNIRNMRLKYVCCCQQWYCRWWESNRADFYFTLLLFEGCTYSEGVCADLDNIDWVYAIRGFWRILQRIRYFDQRSATAFILHPEPNSGVSLVVRWFSGHEPQKKKYKIEFAIISSGACDVRHVTNTTLKIKSFE